jgi:plasmid maintenance system antidote protein VapI
MTDGEKLKAMIDESGISIVKIAEKMGCSRNRIYAIIKGADCTASEIMWFCNILRLTKHQRDEIFLQKCVN